MGDAQDSDWIERIAREDERALGELHARYAQPLYSMVLRIGASEHEAEEIVQDAFLTVWRGAKSFDPARARVFTWLVTIARNKAIDRLRAAGRTGNPASNPTDVNNPIHLAFFRGMTHVEIAQHLGEPVDAVKSQILTALEDLQKRLKGGNP